MSWSRSVLASAWVGWQRELGWTNPAVSFIMKLATPVGSVLTAAIVYWLGSSVAGAYDGARLSYVVVGASMYAHISVYSAVPVWAISEGKWSFVFPQVYISPTSSIPYLTGRSVASFLISAITSLFSLLFAYTFVTTFLGKAMPISFAPSSLAWLAVALVANFPATLGLGLLLGAYTIFASKFEWALPAYVAGMMMIFSESLFPATLLPWPLPWAAWGLPFTYFIRASREALIYGSGTSFLLDLGYTLVGGLALLAVGLLTFRLAERRGRRLGIIDRKVV